MPRRSRAGPTHRIKTGLGSPLSWLLYAGLAALSADLIAKGLYPDRRLAIPAFATTVLIGILWRRRPAAGGSDGPGSLLARLDAMSGAEFEHWITLQLLAAGHVARDVKHSGDFGVDVRAEIDGLRIGIQAKRYHGRVGNDAVQEVLAGCDYHRCEVAAVITQSSFSEAARAQARAGRYPVLLIDRSQVLGIANALHKALVDPAINRRILESRSADLRR